MSKNDIELAGTKSVDVKAKVSPRKHYSKPKLEMLGDLRDLTLGGTRGSGDSSNAGVQNPPKGGHHSLTQPQGISLPGINYSEIPTPDNPFLR